MTKCNSFKASVNNNSKVLILGSMPGIKSLEAQQYYAHPQNRFWKIMGLILKIENFSNFKYEEKLKILLENKIALFDVIKSCDRSGSLDSKIKNEVPNDISALLDKYNNIKIICLNGNKSYSAFKKYFPEILKKYVCFKLPSTSPANAKYSLENLYNKWSKILDN